MWYTKTVLAPWSLGAIALKSGAPSPSETPPPTMVMVAAPEPPQTLTFSFGLAPTNTADGSPPLRHVQSFAVIVLPLPHIEIIALPNDTVALSWRAIPGHTYRVQHKTNLQDAVWNDLPRRCDGQP